MRRVCIGLAVALFAAALPVATAVASLDEPSFPPVEGAAADESGKSTPGAGDPAAEDIEPAPERPLRGVREPGGVTLSGGGSPGRPCG